MLLAIFDPNGWFTGLSKTPVINAVPPPPEGMDLSVARWKGGAWVEDREGRAIEAQQAAALAEAAAAVRYEYDADGWLIGPHSDATRPRSTAVAPDGIAANRARWNGTAWTDDASREASAQRAEIARQIAAQIQGLLDSQAQEWGYDSMLSLATYRDSAVPQFAAEARAGLAWRDAVWAYAGQQQHSNITAEDFWASFPPKPSRPV